MASATLRASARRVQESSTLATDRGVNRGTVIEEPPAFAFTVGWKPSRLPPTTFDAAPRVSPVVIALARSDKLH